MNPDARQTSLHEARHALGCAIGVLLVSPADYSRVTVSWQIRGDEGQLVAEVGDPAASYEDRRASEIVAALHSVAPAARLGKEAVDLVRKSAWEELVERARLSSTDVDLMAPSEYPATTAAKVLLAVAALEERLGLDGILRLARTMWEASNQCVSQDWPLGALVPLDEAEAALGVATRRLEEVLA